MSSGDRFYSLIIEFNNNIFSSFQLHEDDVRVILLTNDVNLSNKAMINNITSTSADNITDLLLDKNKASTDLVRDAMLSSDIVKDLVEMIKDELRVLLEEVNNFFLIV